MKIVERLEILYMILFQNKLLVFLAHGLLLVVDFANLFMTDVLMYEVTTGLTFDYNLMLHNPLFWILLSLHILHIILTAAINIKNSSNDLIVEKAISRQQKKAAFRYYFRGEKRKLL